ncbi:glycosyltransferase [Sphingosinicella terrae]|uniref:glycosyltransferase n=1 Tax=Sphingosinicella terrae TaxID=2172047 RepID=UPI000E0D4570|nr:glycosyltransferase [Sphingosinicella terrae]
MNSAISVIIPIYKDWERLRLCLDALERQTLPADRFEILVANNEPEGHCPLERLPPNARILHEPSPGSYAARNTAVGQSQGRWLAFTDGDCIPDKDWLARGLELLERHPEERITGPVSIFREEGSDYYAYLFDAHTAFPQEQYARDGVCVTANLLVSRAVFDRVGPFEQTMSGGDWEWNMRAHKMGVPIRYDSGVVVAHPARRTLAEIFKKRRRVAGSIAQNRKRSLPIYVLGRIKPPRRLPFKRSNLGWRDWSALYLIAWAKGLVEAHEFSLVKLKLKRPNRA